MNQFNLSQNWLVSLPELNSFMLALMMFFRGLLQFTWTFTLLHGLSFVSVKVIPQVKQFG
jgi:hypothetical protein